MKKNLRQISKFCREQNIPHFTHTLPTGLGDYCFVLVIGNKLYWLPIIFERKRCDDFSSSLAGSDDVSKTRFGTQILAMAKVYDLFSSKLPFAEKPIYIIEGSLEQNVVPCPCPYECVGKCGNPDLKTCKMYVDQLKHQFKVIQTSDIEQTIKQVLTKYYTRFTNDKNYLSQFKPIFNTQENEYEFDHFNETLPLKISSIEIDFKSILRAREEPLSFTPETGKSKVRKDKPKSSPQKKKRKSKKKISSVQINKNNKMQEKKRKKKRKRRDQPKGPPPDSPNRKKRKQKIIFEIEISSSEEENQEEK